MRAAKKEEDQAAVGGMRFPLDAAKRISKSFEAGRRVRQALTKVLTSFPALAAQLEGEGHPEHSAAFEAVDPGRG